MGAPARTGGAKPSTEEEKATCAPRREHSHCCGCTPGPGTEIGEQMRAGASYLVSLSVTRKHSDWWWGTVLPEVDVPLADLWAALLSPACCLCLSQPAGSGDVGALGVCSSGHQSVRCWRLQFCLRIPEPFAGFRLVHRAQEGPWRSIGPIGRQAPSSQAGRGWRTSQQQYLRFFLCYPYKASPQDVDRKVN